MDLAYTVFVRRFADGGVTRMSLWRGDDDLSEPVRLRVGPDDDLVDAVQRRFQVHVLESRQDEDEYGVEWAMTIRTDWLPDARQARPAAELRQAVIDRLGLRPRALPVQRDAAVEGMAAPVD